MSDYEYVPNEDSPAVEPPVASHGYEASDGTGFIFRDAETYRIDGDSIAELNRLWAQLVLRDDTIRSLKTEVDSLRYTQIKGDDPRLSDFWAEAQELATRANHCEVYDDIAEALGGPRRIREYSVTVSVPVTVWVTMSTAVEASDETEAEEYAYDNFRQMSLDNGSYDIDDAEADWDTAQYEVEVA
jgi:hypothetical protein